MSKDGFYDWSFQHSSGGFDNISWRAPRFMPMIIKVPYTLSFKLLSYGMLGLYAVEVHRDSPTTTNMISHHKYICAN